MLILLLGSGYGIENGIHRSFAQDAINSLWIFPGQTSMPHKGLQQGRGIKFVNDDITNLTLNVEEVALISGRVRLEGGEDATISVGQHSAAFKVVGIQPELQEIENIRLMTGRYLHKRDLDEVRKIALVGKVVHEELFPNGGAIGRYIRINKIAFQVVGVFQDPGDTRQEENIYIPLTTMQKVFAGDDRIHNMVLTLQADNALESKRVEDKILNLFARRLQFNSEDERAIFFYNTLESYSKYMKLMKNIRVFIWVIGIGSIVAGIVGISNIMLITVKERTREIGVRKALGATPGSIIDMVLTEAILTTLVFGVVGLLSGIVIVEVLSRMVTKLEYFHNPEVNLWVAMGALGVLVISGGLAGIFPARRAAMVRPVDALRDE